MANKKVQWYMESTGTYQKLELIQFIVVPKQNGENEVLAVCMDESGNFDTYSLDNIQAVF